MDEKRAEEFTGRVLADTAAATIVLAALGDRVGLFKEMAAHGPATTCSTRPSACPGSFDVITMFDVVHDAVDPLGLLRSVRDALRTGGRYLCLGITCSDQPSGNTGPIASLLYGFSILYCMTTSLAEGGEGLGTLGLPEPVLRRQGRLHTGAARRHGQPVQQPLRARAMRAGTMASTRNGPRAAGPGVLPAARPA